LDSSLRDPKVQIRDQSYKRSVSTKNRYKEYTRTQHKKSNIRTGQKYKDVLKNPTEKEHKDFKLEAEVLRQN
jgi:hypothetical protein